MISDSGPTLELVKRFADPYLGQGAEVWLAGMTDLERTHASLDLAGIRSLRKHAEGRGPEFFRAISRVADGEIAWVYVRHDEWVREKADRADVLVAVDPRARLAVEKLARTCARRPSIVLTPGLESAAEGHPLPPVAPLLRIRAAASSIGRLARSHIRQLAGAVLKASATSSGIDLPGIHRAVVAMTPKDSTRWQLYRISGLEARGDLRRASESTAEVLRGLTTTRAQANFLGALALEHLAAGRRPPQLREAVEVELRYADELLSHGHPGMAAASYWEAQRLAFHRGVHFDATSSPLAEDPNGYLSCFRDSTVVRKLSRPSGRNRQALSHPVADIHHVLLATLGNATFLRDITTRLRMRRDVEVRAISSPDIGGVRTFTGDPLRLITSLLADDGNAQAAARAGLQDHVDWADTVFVDWCTPLVRMFQLLDLGEKPLIVRLHSFEAFTQWPMLLDLSRLDKLIFVSAHLRDLVLAERPDIVTSGVATPVLINGIDLRRFVRSKTADARYTVAMIGFNAVAKDIMWALEVMRILRRRHPQYRLLLIGADFPDPLSASGARYIDTFRQQAAELEGSGALIRIGQVADVPAALTGAGTVLCSSVREGSPVGVVEAAASGCVPVIRDWPFFSRDGRGARAMYPNAWVVDTPLEAAHRILEVTSDVTKWSEESRLCSADSLANWDITAIGSAYDALFSSPTTTSAT